MERIRHALRVQVAHGLRTRALPVLLVFAGLAAVALFVARGVPDYGQSLALELGAEFIGALVVIFALTPIVRRAQQRRIKEHRQLDFSWYTDRVMTATTTVCILHTFSRLFAAPFSERFLVAATALLRRGGTVQILLLHPDSVAAAQRTTELAGRGDVARASRDNLRTLQTFRQGLAEEPRTRFQVRLYAVAAGVQMYRWDDRLLASFLPLGQLSGDHSQLEVSVDSPLGNFVAERFDELWARGTAITDYWQLPVVVSGEDGRREYLCRFLSLDGSQYLAGPWVIADLARSRSSLKVEWPHAPGISHDIEIFADGEPGAAAVKTAFAEKYGQPEPVFVRLVPPAG